MIKLTNLQKIYRTKEIETVALENVNLEVQQGEFLSIMGPSGCGKSTLLNIMGLLDLPTSGTVEINGVNTVGMSDKELAAFRNKQLGFVFQSFHLINSLNVLDNVELPLLYRKVSSSERRKLAEAVLEKVGLSHRMRHFPTQLSGGQCQRVAIARAIVARSCSSSNFFCWIRKIKRITPYANNIPAMIYNAIAHPVAQNGGRIVICKLVISLLQIRSLFIAFTLKV